MTSMAEAIQAYEGVPSSLEVLYASGTYEGENKVRAARAVRALAAYCGCGTREEGGDPSDEGIAETGADLVCDLLHLLEQLGEDPAYAIEVAQRNYVAESTLDASTDAKENMA